MRTGPPGERGLLTQSPIDTRTVGSGDGRRLPDTRSGFERSVGRVAGLAVLRADGVALGRSDGSDGSDDGLDAGVLGFGAGRSVGFPCGRSDDSALGRSDGRPDGCWLPCADGRSDGSDLTGVAAPGAGRSPPSRTSLVTTATQSPAAWHSVAVVRRAAPQSAGLTECEIAVPVAPTAKAATAKPVANLPATAVPAPDANRKPSLP